MSVRLTYFVHSTTIDNERKLATGWLPGTLSDVGWQQANALRDQVAHLNFDLVFCSDLKRAIDSATFVFGQRYQICQDARLRECNYGDYNGRPVAEFKENITQYIDTPFPSGESYKDVEQRLVSFCEFLIHNYEGKHIAIVAHQAPQLALDVHVKGLSWEHAIEQDWRKKKAWQPGWDYKI